MFRTLVATSSKASTQRTAARTSIAIRALSSSPSSYKSFNQPRPPPLPKADQEEFDALIKANQTVGASPLVTAPTEELKHRDLRKPLKPEFEGDVNPKTGERGGPKRDPFVAGDADWQYGGRVTVSRNLGSSVADHCRTFSSAFCSDSWNVSLSCHSRRRVRHDCATQERA